LYGNDSNIFGKKRPHGDIGLGAGPPGIPGCRILALPPFVAKFQPQAAFYHENTCQEIIWRLYKGAKRIIRNRQVDI
jgi:hypothetical protein